MSVDESDSSTRWLINLSTAKGRRTGRRVGAQVAKADEIHLSSSSFVLTFKRDRLIRQQIWEHLWNKHLWYCDILWRIMVKKLLIMIVLSIRFLNERGSFFSIGLYSVNSDLINVLLQRGVAWNRCYSVQKRWPHITCQLPYSYGYFLHCQCVGFLYPRNVWVLTALSDKHSFDSSLSSNCCSHLKEFIDELKEFVYTKAVNCVPYKQTTSTLITRRCEIWSPLLVEVLHSRLKRGS